ncbi:MAG TPA: zf-HC2 domain-containing protein [Pyrinomonadaceae bacterium]|jgi:hypothetical protein|nr:zf-HC2 domain-containing protein [Pyrinomonadaceae bacterium]
MNERDHSPTCERASDLIAFIYDELEEREAQEFQQHLHECASCREEAALFGIVRESITAWRDEALAGFVSTPVTTKTVRKSALTALGQFFDLSPLWLRGATAFALLAFCLLLGIVVFKDRNPQVAEKNPNAIYTPQDVDRMVKDALARQQRSTQQQEPTAQNVNSPKQTVKYKKPRDSQPASSNQFAKSRRPLSRAEREQLAADLRLLTTRDDAPLQLLGDRINQ